MMKNRGILMVESTEVCSCFFCVSKFAQFFAARSNILLPIIRTSRVALWLIFTVKRAVSKNIEIALFIRRCARSRDLRNDNLYQIAGFCF